MEDYMKRLLTDPLHADTDDFLKGHGIDGCKALSILSKRTDPEDENSAVVIRTEKIKDNGTDKNGKRLKDSFTVKYRIPRKDYSKKMRNLYISLFENTMLNEDGEGCGGGATSADASGQYSAPLFGKPLRRTIYITKEQAEDIKKTLQEEVVLNTPIGNFGYDAPIGDGKKNGSNEFYKDANDHNSMMAKSWQSNLNEARGLKSQKLFDIFKEYGRGTGYIQNGHRKVFSDAGDLHELTDDDVIGVFTYEEVKMAKLNPKEWAKHYGFQMNDTDNLDAIELGKKDTLGNNLYAVVIERSYKSAEYSFDEKLAARFKKNSGLDGAKQYRWKDNNDYWRLMAQNPWYKDWDDEARKRLQNDISRTYRGGNKND